MTTAISDSDRRRLPIVLIAVFGVLIGGTLHACNIPVFRYALERWAPDSADIIVFHDGPLSADERERVAAIEGLTRGGNGAANILCREYDIHSQKDEDLTALWKRLARQQATKTPYIVVRSHASKGATVNNWHGSLSDFPQSQTVSSPVRKEIGRRLLSGTSVVWLVLKSADEKKTEAAISRLKKDLATLSRSIELPDGIGLPGSELMSEVPLLMKFSVLTVAPDDKKEAYLVDLLQGLAPESLSEKEPLIVPVFGRGRALEVIAASDLTSDLTKDLTMFLCSACSCQVKEMNPGFDLLMSTDWTTELYGEDGQDPDSNGFQRQKNDGVPVLIDIPAGRGK